MMKKNFLLFTLIFAFLSASLVADAQCGTTSYPPPAFKCPGRAYNFYGTLVYTPGIYTDTIVLGAGCDSFVTQQIIDYPLVVTNQYDTICQGLSYSFYGNTLSQSGIYYDTLNTANAPYCDSIIALYLTVTPSHNDSINMTGSGCVTRTGGGPGGGTFSGGYIFYGDTLRASGTYAHHITGTSACADTVYVLRLTIGNAGQPTTQNIGICTGHSYTINGHTYTTSSTQGNPYRDTLTSSLGCDSIVLTNLTVSPYVNGPTTNATFCTSYVWRGHTYTTASPVGGPGGGGGYKDTVIATGSACDSIYTLMLRQVTSIAINQNGTLCNGGPYIWRGHSYTVASPVGPTGGYHDTVPSATGGCDSIYTLNLRNGFAPTTTTRDSFCFGTSYLFHGQSYNRSGRDTVYASNTNGGCDSMYVLILTYKAAPTVIIADSLCQGGIFVYGTDTFTVSGNHPVGTRPTASGCDTVIVLHLTYKAAPAYTIADSFCRGGSITYKGSTFTTTGAHTITIASPSGCDTVITLNLSYKTAPARTVTGTACFGTNYIYGRDTFAVGFQGINQTITVAAPTGCDSLITLTISASPPPNIRITDSFCVGTIYHYRTDTFSTTGIHNLTLPSNTGGCDTIVLLTLRNRTSSGTVTISRVGNNLLANTTATNITYQWYLNGVAISGATSQLYSATGNGSYTVDIVNGTLCTSASAAFSVSDINGISDVASDMFKLYPNPNTGKFTLETQNFIGTDVLIYDVYGRLVFEKQLNSDKETIDMSNAAGGTYYLSMKNKQYSTYAHFVIAQ